MKSVRLLSRLSAVFSPVGIFLINLSLVLTIVITVIYAGVYYRSNALLVQSVRDEAASYFDLIIKTREWNSRHDGVYVEKKPGVETNPWLPALGVEPEIRTADGRVFTLRNPAIMMREISELMDKDLGASFHLTSLKPLNPGNSPDGFEERSLKQFARGIKETWEIQRSDGSSYLRLMRPLKVGESCLKCHESQGYKVGDIRGGISIRVPFHETDGQLKMNMLIMIALSFLTLGIVFAAVYVMASVMVKKLDAAQEQLKEASITDALTGMKNRRYIMEKLAEEFERFERTSSVFGIIMMDIDHFKAVNDAFGHVFGDLVLKTVAERMMKHMRIYDLAGRYGGEEFIIVAPGIASPELTKLAERTAEIIRAEKITDGVNEIKVTVSIGATLVNPSDKSYETVLQRADSALYKAKQEGRNRVVSV